MAVKINFQDKDQPQPVSWKEWSKFVATAVTGSAVMLTLAYCNVNRLKSNSAQLENK